MTSLDQKTRKHSSVLILTMLLSWNCTFLGIPSPICKMGMKWVAGYVTWVSRSSHPGVTEMLSVPVGESCGEVKGDGHMVSTGLPPWVAGRSLCGEWGSSTSQPHVSGSLGLSVPPSTSAVE